MRRRISLAMSIMIIKRHDFIDFGQHVALDVWVSIFIYGHSGSRMRHEHVANAMLNPLLPHNLPDLRRDLYQFSP